MVKASPRPLYPRERDTVSFYRRLRGTLGWSGRVWKISPPPGFDPLTLHPVASRYTDCAAVAHLRSGKVIKITMPCSFCVCFGVVYLLTCFISRCLVCIVVVVLYVLSSYVYLLHCVCIVVFFLLQMPDCWLEVSIRKVLLPATSTHGFLGFPVSISKCWDGSQHSKLPLHASHVALQT